MSEVPDTGLRATNDDRLTAEEEPVLPAQQRWAGFGCCRAHGRDPLYGVNRAPLSSFKRCTRGLEGKYPMGFAGKRIDRPLPSSTSMR